MNTKFDAQKLLIEIEVTEDDLLDADRLRKLIESPEWKIMQNGYAHIRELIIESIKNVTTSEASAKMTAFRGCVLKGFDECIRMPETIIRQAEVLKKKRSIALEEENHDAPDEPEQ